MLKFDTSSLTFEKLEETELKTQGLLERYDLQKAIVHSWDLFKNEIGFPSAFLIGQEIKPHDATGDSIDLVAFDPDESSIIIIELKRDKNKLQLLQALSYAAMISQWGTEDLIDNIQKECNPNPEELIDLINSNEINQQIKILLIAELFDPEVIITSDWLKTLYDVDISAFAISLNKMGEHHFLEIEQRYPLKELSDAFDARSRRVKRKGKKPKVDWDDVLPKLKYPFAERGIELCKKITIGDPPRRRFGRIRTNHDGFSWISLNFREKYINVYLGGDFDGAQEFLQSKFKDPIKVNTWRDGYSFLVEAQGQFDDLISWLRLE
jgi:hypothetical protein